VKGVSSHSKPAKGSRIDKRSRYIWVNPEHPILFLKASHSRFSFSSCLEKVCPSSDWRVVIVFFLCLIEALAWKSYVHSSPNFTYFVVPLCFR
jgi:hypothetical protein